VKNLLIAASFLFFVCTGFSQSITVSSLVKSSFCEGDKVWFPYSATGFSAENSFKIEIRSISGGYSSTPLYIGEKESSASGLDSVSVIFPASFPGDLAQFVYRIVSTSPVVQSAEGQTISILPKPIFDFTSNDSVFCITESAFKLSYSASGLTTSFSGAGVTNNSFLPATAGEGYHYLYCKVTNANGCFSIDSLKIKVNSTPSPSVLSKEYITPKTSQNVYATGDSLTWYSDSTLTNPLITGETFQYVLPNTDTGTHYLYVTQNLNNCESNPVKVAVIYRPKVIVSICNAKKPIIVNSMVSLCQGDATVIKDTAYYTNFNNIEWLDGSNTANANVVSKSAVFQFQKQNSPGTWLYYAFEHDTLNDCYGAGAEFTVVVYPKPSVTLYVPNTVCASTQTVQIVASPTGGILQVFDSVLTDYSFHPGQLRLKMHKDTIPISYYYSDDKGCITTVNQKVVVRFVYQPSGAGDMIGYLDSIPELYAFGDDSLSVVSWYKDIAQPAVFVGEYYKPNIVQIGDYTYYVSQMSKGCVSDVVPVKLSILSGSGTGSSELSGESEFSVYPVPAKDIISLTGITKANVTIFSTEGIKVASVETTDGRINIKELPAGVYFLQVNAGYKFLGAKMIKE